jgi:hypothetical protein
MAVIRRGSASHCGGGSPPRRPSAPDARPRR